jgi:hypothetical protein
MDPVTPSLAIHLLNQDGLETTLTLGLVYLPALTRNLPWAKA